jgi:hypothetical protein
MEIEYIANLRFDHSPFRLVTDDERSYWYTRQELMDLIEQAAAALKEEDSYR